MYKFDIGDKVRYIGPRDFLYQEDAFIVDRKDCGMEDDPHPTYTIQYEGPFGRCFMDEIDEFDLELTNPSAFQFTPAVAECPFCAQMEAVADVDKYLREQRPSLRDTRPDKLRFKAALAVERVSLNDPSDTFGHTTYNHFALNFCPVCGKAFRRHEVIPAVPAADAPIDNTGVAAPVRCKDCRYRYCEGECPMYHIDRDWSDSLDEYLETAVDETTDDGFCNRGKRYED